MKVDEDLATILKQEAELAELEEDSDEDVWVPRRPPRRASMVYSVRIPVDRVEELRQLAAGTGLDPSAMVRQWVLERLDSEQRQGSEEEDLASLMLATVSEIKKTGWSVIFTPDPEPFKSFLVKIPASAGSRSRGAPAKAAAAKKMPAKAAAAKKMPAKAAPGGKKVAAPAAKKMPANAAPQKRTKRES